MSGCNMGKPGNTLKDGQSYNAPALLFFKNIRANAYTQTKKAKYLDSYQLKHFEGKAFSMELLISPLEDKALLNIVLKPNYEIWENIVENRAKLIELENLDAKEQIDLLRKMSSPDGHNYAVQFIDPNTNGSIETISNKTFRKNITICLSDFDRLVTKKKQQK